MLLRNHGALSLGKILRRPIVITGKESKQLGSSTTHMMRTTATKMAGQRGLSQAARSTIAPSPQMQTQTWNHNYGIVFSGPWSPTNGIAFGSAAGTPRSINTSAVEAMDQEHMLHSHSDNRHVIASAIATGMDCKPNAQPIPASRFAVKIGPVATAAAGSKEIASPSTTDTEVLKEPEPEDLAQNELPETTTSFKMNEELFRRAKNADPGSREAYWSHTLYRGPVVNGKPQKTTVHYCKSIHTTERVLKTYFKDARVLGFDIEWKENALRHHGAKKNVSLIQIASEDRIALFHIALYPGHDVVSPRFKRLMEDPAITKVGVSIKADCTRLRNYMSIESQGLFELSHLYKLVKYSTSRELPLINKKLVKLARQTWEHLHLPMFKGDVRMSDWSRPLNLEQITYAASDSYAGLQLFHTLEMKREKLRPTPPRPWHAELDLPIRVAEGLVIESGDDDGEEQELAPPPESPSASEKADIDPESIKLEDKKAGDEAAPAGEEGDRPLFAFHLKDTELHIPASPSIEFEDRSHPAVSYPDLRTD
ncbi:3 -5 exonuclease helicase [Diplocarpon rosae]|nr:3 -5 exonuclease helicase [Diplocarpon rosae]